MTTSARNLQSLALYPALVLAMGIWLSGCPGSSKTSVSTIAAPGQTIGCPAGLNLLSASCCDASGKQVTFNTNCPPPFTPDNPPTIPAAQMASAANQALSDANAAVSRSLAMKPGSSPGSSAAMAGTIVPLSGTSLNSPAQISAAMAAPAGGVANPGLSPSSAAMGGGVAGGAGVPGGGGGMADGAAGAGFGGIGGDFTGGMGSLGATTPLTSEPASAKQGPVPAGQLDAGAGIGMMSAGSPMPPGKSGGTDFGSLLGGVIPQGLAPSSNGAGVKDARFAGEANRTLASADPADYFSRSSSFDNLFKLVERCYQQTQMDWTLSETRELGERAPASAARKPALMRTMAP